MLPPDVRFKETLSQLSLRSARRLEVQGSRGRTNGDSQGLSGAVWSKDEARNPRSKTQVRPSNPATRDLSPGPKSRWACTAGVVEHAIESRAEGICIMRSPRVCLKTLSRL